MGPELDVYYMRSRWYEPFSGRFLSEDPLGLDGGLNQFTFAADDPINHADPSGRCEEGDVLVEAQLVQNDDGDWWLAEKCQHSDGTQYPYWEPSLPPVTVSAPPWGVPLPPMSEWERRLALDDFNEGMRRRSRIHAAEIIGQRAKCALGALAFGVNAVESLYFFIGGGVVMLSVGEQFMAAGLSLTGADVTASFATADATMNAGGEALAELINYKGIALKGVATVSDLGNGELGAATFVPVAGAIQAGYTIAENCGS